MGTPPPYSYGALLLSKRNPQSSIRAGRNDSGTGTEGGPVGLSIRNNSPRHREGRILGFNL